MTTALPSRRCVLAPLGVVVLCIAHVFGAVGVETARADEPWRSTALPGRTRSPVYGSAAVSSGQPLATAIGVDVLRNGGKAADAAVAVAAALSVLEPMLGGPGGDVSILYWDNKAKKLYGLDSRGRLPAELVAGKPDGSAESQPEAKPASSTGTLTWTTPGAVDGWFELHERFGTRAWEDLFQPAIELASDGFPVSAATAREWKLGAERLSGQGASALLVDGQPPRAGVVMQNDDFARTLKQIAAGGRAVFYEGELGQTLVAFGKGLGGLLSVDDLAAHRSVWVTPIDLQYRNVTVETLPTSTYGVAGLEMLGVMSAFDVSEMGRTSSQYWHLLIESQKAAVADVMAVKEAELANVLTPEWTAEKRRSIDPNKASAGAIASPIPSEIRASTAVIVDADGDACVLVQDLGDRFGSGVVPGAVGFVMQNRAAGVTATNGLQRLHARVPVVISRDGVPIGFIATSSGANGASLLAQTVTALIDFKLDAQSAVDFPRVLRVAGDDKHYVRIESGISTSIGEELKSRNHVIATERDAADVGAIGGEAHAILRSPSNDSARTAPISTGSDPRHDANAVAF